MNFQLFFDALTEEEVVFFRKVEGLAQAVDFHAGGLPNWRKADLALFSIGAEHERNAREDFKSVRESFYRLQDFSRSVQIIDLGHLRPGKNLEATQLRLSEVCEQLIAENTLPVILGSSHELDFGQFKAYEGLEKIITLVNVDAEVDVGYGNSYGEGQHVHQILTHHPNFLFEYCHLAYQRYFINPKTITALRQLNFDIRSVGQLREHFKEVEPVVRSGDMLSFDLSAIRATEAAGTANRHPFGLTGEEACQLCWYAGMNEKLTSTGFYEYRSEKDTLGGTAAILATMIWYFIEGFCHRKKEYSFKSNFHIKYIVPLEKEGKNLIFYKSLVTNKWWMEVALQSYPSLPFKRNTIIPCSYQDYEQATQGELPERWIKAVGKL